MATIESELEALGVRANRIDALSGDASQRLFFRAVCEEGRSVVVAQYPAGAQGHAERDFAIQVWGARQGLPLPQPIARTGLLTVSEDLGDEDLATALTLRGPAVLEAALECLAVFGRTPWREITTPPFDAAFFRRELAGFVEYAVPAENRSESSMLGFLDDLANRVCRHPYRLVHRDFHANNLFVVGASVRAVDFQDMRGGPDTYDLASLLRERAVAEKVGDTERWALRGAEVLGLEDGWRQRYLECAAQRGLKVVGTFLRLAAAGRPAYLSYLPAVRRMTLAALQELHAPPVLLEELASPRGGEKRGQRGE